MDSNQQQTSTLTLNSEIYTEEEQQQQKFDKIESFPGRLMRNLTNLGLTEGMDKNIIKKIKLSNQMSLMMVLIVAVSIGIFSSTTDDIKLILLVASILIIPTITLTLNVLKMTRTSRLLMSALTTLYLLIVIVLVKKIGEPPQFVINEYHFYTPRYFLMAIALMPIFLIDLKEKSFFYSALVINAICLALFDTFHSLAGVSPEAFNFEFENYYQATVMPIVLLIFLYGSLISYQLENKRYEERIENLLEKEKIYTDRIKGKVKIAKAVIDGLIPKQMPEIKNLELAGALQWSSEVGGDYYNVIKINEDEHLLILADVVGKGLGASILVSTMHSNIETQIENGIEDLQSFIERLNEVLCRVTDKKKFVTCWAGIYNSKKNELTSLNAGHIPPLVIDSHKKVRHNLNKGGPILGFFDRDEIQHQIEKINLNKGDTVLAFTDGVSEASGQTEESVMYEQSNRLGSVIEASWEHPADLLDRIVKDVQEYSGRDSFEDDLTCLIFKRKT